MNASEHVRVETVTLSDAGIAMILLDQERRNKISAIKRVDRQLSQLKMLREQYLLEYDQVMVGIDGLNQRNTYDLYEEIGWKR